MTEFDGCVVNVLSSCWVQNYPSYTTHKWRRWEGNCTTPLSSVFPALLQNLTAWDIIQKITPTSWTETTEQKWKVEEETGEGGILMVWIARYSDLLTYSVTAVWTFSTLPKPQNFFGQNRIFAENQLKTKLAETVQLVVFGETEFWSVSSFNFCLY